MRRPEILLVVALALLASGCAEEAPPPRPAPPPPPVVDGRVAAAHDLAVAHARSQEAQGRLREALFWRRVAAATALNPAADAAEIERLHAAIKSAIAEAFALAEQNRAAGLSSRAEAAYRAVLDLDPGNTTARDALRAADRATKLRAIERGGGGGPPASRSRE